MSVDERSRLQLAEALKRALGPDEGITLMELLPPVGWADVATKHDLQNIEGRMDARFENLEVRMAFSFENLEHRLEARFERGFRQVVVTTASLIVTGFVAMIGALVAVVKL